MRWLHGKKKAHIEIRDGSWFFRSSTIDAVGPITRRAPGNLIEFYFIVYCSGAAVVVEGNTLQEVKRIRVNIVEEWIKVVNK